MARRSPETLADYVVVAIAPMLIMLLVGSLVFFLIEVFYHGQYPLRLMWVMGLFVMATVCVARISMEEGASYAALFGAPLAVVVGIALVKFVQIEGPLAPISPLINWGLMALIWWCADRLTWDCTLIDDSQDTTNQGLLQSMGWEVPAFLSRGRMGESSGDRAAESESSPQPSDLEAVTETAAPQAPWWQRWFGHDKRPAAHGKWVVYFSVAALPLFGMGQWFIPASAAASGLGLLLTTSFLGLRRYIRQRRLEMPLDMTASWLTSGVVMILALLIVAALLPRPSPEFTLVPKFLQFDSTERTASRWSTGPEGTKSPQPQSNAADAQANQQADQAGGQSGEQAQDEQSDGQKQSGSEAGKTDGGDARGGNSKNGKSGDDSSGQGKQQDGKQSANSQNGTKPGETKSSQQQPGGEQSAGKGDRQKSGASESQRRSSGSQRDANNQQDNGSAQGTAPPPTSPRPSPINPANLLANLGSLLRWLLYAALALVIAWLAWKYRRELYAAWRQLLKELRELWDWWFGRDRNGEEAAALAAAAAPPPSFAQFSDPFLTGQAARMSPAQMVVYSFQALEAWARDYATQRAAGQTPHEFAEQLQETAPPPLGSPARQLAEIYSRIAYASAAPPPQTEAVLRNLWNAMTGLARQPAPVTAGTAGRPAGIA